MGYPDEKALFKSAPGMPPQARQYSTMAEFKKAQLANAAPDAMSQVAALRRFDAQPAVARFNANLAQAKVRFYQQHPAELVKDVDAKAQSITSSVILQRIYRAEKAREGAVATH